MIEARGLSKRYGDLVAVDGVSFQIGRGEVVGDYAVPRHDAEMKQMQRRAPPFVHGSVMMRREAYERAGGYRAAFRASQDYDLWLRMADHATFGRV